MRGDLAMARKKKSLVELGVVARERDAFRARMQVGRGEQHRGASRSSEVKATTDLVLLRGVASREDVGSIAARLRAVAKASRSIVVGRVYKKKSLAELGSVERNKDGFRAWMRVGWFESHQVDRGAHSQVGVRGHGRPRFAPWSPFTRGGGLGR